MHMKRFCLLSILALSLAGCLDDDTPDKNLQQILAEREDLTIMVTSLQRVGLYDLLENAAATVLSPTDQAFQNFFVQQGYSSIEIVSDSVLNSIISYHILPFFATTNAVNNIAPIESGYYATSNSESPTGFNLSLLLINNGASLTFNNTAQTLVEDLRAGNGFVHTIDRVLIPPTVSDVIDQNENLSIMGNALREAALLDTATSSEVYTYLIPPDESMETYLTQRGFDDLDDMPDSTRLTLIQSHVLEGNIGIQQLIDDETITTLAKTTVIKAQQQFVSGTGGNISVAVLNDTAVVRFPNVQAINGILHLVTEVVPIRN